MWFFRWIREQVRDAVVGGFRDGAEELGITEAQARERLGLAPAAAEAKSLPPAEPEGEEPAPAGRRGGGKGK